MLPAGVILQSAREASLLRVLGTTKRRTRAMLSLEQLFLCLAGLCLAIAALVLAEGGALTAVAGLADMVCRVKDWVLMPMEQEGKPT